MNNGGGVVSKEFSAFDDEPADLVRAKELHLKAMEIYRDSCHFFSERRSKFYGSKSKRVNFIRMLSIDFDNSCDELGFDQKKSERLIRKSMALTSGSVEDSYIKILKTHYYAHIGCYVLLLQDNTYVQLLDGGIWIISDEKSAMVGITPGLDLEFFEDKNNIFNGKNSRFVIKK